ncbi:MAG TPA: hypothetical protein VGQ46_16285 [Thermoanaerobaculia bacterium]|nr:hypothetical protein [Thermoanaerobaculia bacterium]
MTRDEILRAMDANRARLSALGVVELALFGSHAREMPGRRVTSIFWSSFPRSRSTATWI